MTPDLSINSKHSVGKRIAANTGLMVGSKIVAVILGAGSLYIAAKELDIYTFGILVFMHSYMLFFAEVVNFQSWQSIIRFGTDDVKDNNAKGLAKILNFGVRLDILSACFGFVLAISIFLLIGYLLKSFPDVFAGSKSFDIEVLQKYVLGYCTLILLSQRGTSIGIFRLFDKFRVLAVKALIMPVVRFMGAFVAMKMDGGLTGFISAWYFGSLCAYLFIPTMAALELKRRNLLNHVLKVKVKFRSPGKGIWPFVIKSNLDSTLAAANLHLPALLIMGVFGAAWVSVYKIAEEFAKLLSEGFVLLDQVIYPELAKLVSIGEVDKIWRLVTRAALILLSFGLCMSLIMMLIGPELLSRLLSKDYSLAAPLTSLLVPAAALLGTAAPLYPVLYAANKPERAIYARGTGVLVYIISFFIFAFTIGKMAPGFAAILGNASAVALVVFMAKRTLGQAMQPGEAVMQEGEVIPPQLNLIGETKVKLWGLSLRQWQQRAYKKAGVFQGCDAPTTLHIAVEYVLSSALAKAFVARGKTALVADGKIIGVNDTDLETAQKLIGQDISALVGTDITPVHPDELDDGYNKALRKKEPPYALDVNTTPIADIQRRQFASSYKGITDFVTKWVWPVPAFYVTRACAAMRLTPNMVTTVGLFLTCAAMYYFWQGQWLLGFAAGWLMTFLDTVDGKLARTTMTYSWWGNIYDHGIDLIHPPFWYWAWFVGLGSRFVWPNIASDPMTLALSAILVGYIVDRIIEGIFMRQHGFHIHVWTKANSALRFFIARRNPNVFIFMIGICLTPWFPEAGRWAFYTVAIWVWICIFLNLVSFLLGCIAKEPLKSWMDA